MAYNICGICHFIELELGKLMKPPLASICIYAYIHLLYMYVYALNLESWGENNPECFEMGGDERWWRRIMWLHVQRVGEHAQSK